MSNWRRWVRPGLAATIVLALLAVALRLGGVEDDLEQRVTSQLRADGQDWASVAVSGRGVTIRGTAPTPESREDAVRATRAVSGVASVVDEAGLLPVASPYVWSARRQGRSVVMSGYVTSEATRNSVMVAARRALPDAEILDETELARGAATTFNAATAFALDRLAELSSGLVTITDGTLSVAGTAATSESYAGGRQAFAEGVPGGVTLGGVDIAPARADPFVWSASRGADSMTLAGFVPNDVVKSELVEAARLAMPGVAIVDNMNIASGEPEGFAEAAAFGVEALSRLEEGGVMLDGLTLDIAGTALTVEDYEVVVDGIGGTLPDGVEIVANAIKPAPVEEYGWTGRREGNEVTLTGYVPSLEGRAELRELAQELFAGARLTDNVKIASGEPQMDWIGGIKFAMGQLAQLETGMATLNGQSYAIEGEAADSDAFQRLTSRNERTLPSSLELAGSEIVPPQISPYTLSLERSGDGLALVGYVADPSDKDALFDAAFRAFGDTPLTDSVTFASGAPDDLVGAASGAMQAVARLAGGHFEITDTVVDIGGTTFHDGAMKRIAAIATDRIPETFKTRLAVVTRQVGQSLDEVGCRERIASALKEGRVEFDKGATEISLDSYPLLDRIVGILMRCPEAAVEVGGHSDSDGSEKANLELTQARADAVADYLIDAGVRFERVTAVGYGEANPIADNNTDAGKAANRRIEFTLGAEIKAAEEEQGETATEEEQGG